MKYKVQFTKRAMKDLKKLDRSTSALILGWVRKNLEIVKIHGCTGRA